MINARTGHYKAVTTNQKKAKKAGSIIGDIFLLQSAAWFAALSNIVKSLNKFFRNYQDSFFIVSISLSILRWGLSFAKYINAPNKNIKNTAGLAYKTFNLAMYGAIIAAFLVGGAVMGSMFYYMFCLVDPVFNLLKAGFYFYKQYNASNPEEAKFYYQKCQKTAKMAVIFGLLTLAMLALWVVPGLPLAVTAIVGVMGVVAALSPLVYKLGKAIYDCFNKKEAGYELLTENKLKADNKLTSDVDNSPKWKSKFARGSSLSVLTTASLKAKVVKKIARMEAKIEVNKDSFLEHFSMFAENPKRENKKNALEFLSSLLNKFNKGELADKGTVQIKDKLFFYNDKADLASQIERHIVKAYPGAYQSFHRYQSRVSICFQEAYQLIQGSSSDEKLAL